MYAVRLVTKAQIVGHWIAIKTNDLPDTTTKMMVTDIISSTAIAIQLVEENFDNFYRDCALMSAVTNTGQNNGPRNFQEAWYHQNPEKRQNWRVAICKEFKDMIRR